MARLMKQEKFEFTPGERLILFYRQNPEVAAEDLLGIKLIWLQRIMLRALWFKRFAMLNIARGCSKSTVLEIFAILKATLYPGVQIGFVTPVYRQVQHYLFPDMSRMIRNAPLIKICIEGHMKMDQQACLIKFKHGSFIEGLPPGNDGKNIRGRRYHVVLVDEYAQTDDQIIKEAIRPMLNVKVYGRANQYHVSSTPYYKWNHMWPQYLHHINMSKKHPKHYELVEFDYRDVNETPVSRLMPILPYSIDEHIIAMQKSDMTEEQFKMENLARFPDDVSTFFSSKLIDFASPRKNPVDIELVGKKHEGYYLGIDIGRIVDNFAISVLRVDGEKRKLVRVKSANKATFPEMNDIIRRTLLEYNVKQIAIGAGGGGLAIKDLLAQEWIDRTTGITHEKILCLPGEDEKHDKMQGLRILHVLDETGKINNFLYTSLKKDMENGIFQMPSPGLFSGIVLTPQEEDAITEIIKTQEELLKIQAIPSSMGHKFEPPSKKDRKDRATSVVLANYLLVEKNKEYKREVKLPCGFWVEAG